MMAQQNRENEAVPAQILRTITQTAELLGLSVRTVQRMRAAGELGFITVGTGTRQPRVRFTQQHLDEYLLRAEHAARTLPAARRPRSELTGGV